ncbi:MAG: hypothetical protein QM736_20120, partial [Vicinamibacterales bacterium]
MFARHGVPYRSPWFYPTPDGPTRFIESDDFIVDDVRLVPRPTPLPTDIMGGCGRSPAGQFAGSRPGLDRGDGERRGGAAGALAVRQSRALDRQVLFGFIVFPINL